MLYQLHKGERIDTEPTLGFNVEIVEHDGVRMTIWDLGGQQKIRDCWKKYFLQAHGIIFVVDSADAERFEEAKTELQKMLSNPDIKSHWFDLYEPHLTVKGIRLVALAAKD